MKKKKVLSVKELIQVPDQYKMLAAHYGTDFDLDAFGFAQFWAHATKYSSPDYFASGLERKGAGQLCEFFMARLEPKITQAVKTGDGTFLRKLADTIERHTKPIDPARALIAGMAACQKQGHDVEGGWDRTAAEWCNEISRQLRIPPPVEGLDYYLEHKNEVVWSADRLAEISRQAGPAIDIVLFRRWAKEMGLRLKPDKKGRKSRSKATRKKAN